MQTARTDAVVVTPTPISDGRPSIRVLDLSDGLGAYCTKLLADLGADVIKAEDPSGDRLRQCPPFVGEDGPSAIFAAYHANKRGITVEASRQSSLPILEALGRHCDVVVASPTARRPLIGFDRDRPGVTWTRPDAIVAAITPFGLTGPQRDLRMTPFLSFAMGGGMHRSGQVDGPPLSIPGHLAWDEAGIHAAIGILAALEARDRVGGQILDLSVHEVAAAKDFLLERYDVGHPGEWGRSVAVGIPPTGVWECADGPLAVASHQDHHWGAFLKMLDDPEVLSDPAFSDQVFRRDTFDLLEQLITPLMARHDRMSLFEKGQAAGLPCAPFNTPGDFVADVQPQDRHTFLSVPFEEVATRFPWRWCHAQPDLLDLRRPPPSLGQHNFEVYVGELGFSAAQLQEWKEAGNV